MEEVATQQSWRQLGITFAQVVPRLIIAILIAIPLWGFAIVLRFIFEELHTGWRFGGQLVDGFWKNVR